MIKFNITSKLPTLNEYINIERANKFSASKVKKKYTEICGLSAISIKNKVKKDTVYSLIINWNVDNSRTDPDNIYFGIKFILDGLVNIGILQGDDRRYIRNIHNNIETVKKYKVEVILIPE